MFIKLPKNPPVTLALPLMNTLALALTCSPSMLPTVVRLPARTLPVALTRPPVTTLPAVILPVTLDVAELACKVTSKLPATVTLLGNPNVT